LEHKKKQFAPEFEITSRAGKTSERVVMVAGGAGFIGANLCRRLLERGDNVICIDNLETGRHQNVAGLVSNPSFRFYLHDIISPFSVTGPVDQIYNLACPASPKKYQKDPIHTFLTSVIGALNLLDIAALKNATVLQSSTSEVYGDPDVSPQSESFRGLVNTIGPRACYDEGKRAAETLFHDMYEVRHVDVRIARIFNTYGPMMDSEDGRVVSNFVVQALKGEALTVYGTGEQTRSFCYISDMLDGLIALMECVVCGADPVNLGNPIEFTINELAELVSNRIPTAGGVVYEGLPEDDPHQRRPDISLAKSRMGWEPTVSLSEGLEETIKYLRAELEEIQNLRPAESDS